jgi:hypothetical protein
MGRPTMTYVDQLRKDTGLSTKELKRTVNDHEAWKRLVNDVRVFWN